MQLVGLLRRIARWGHGRPVAALGSSFGAVVVVAGISHASVSYLNGVAALRRPAAPLEIPARPVAEDEEATDEERLRRIASSLDPSSSESADRSLTTAVETQTAAGVGADDLLKCLENLSALRKGFGLSSAVGYCADRIKAAEAARGTDPESYDPRLDVLLLNATPREDKLRWAKRMVAIAWSVERQCPTFVVDWPSLSEYFTDLDILPSDLETHHDEIEQEAGYFVSLEQHIDQTQPGQGCATIYRQYGDGGVQRNFLHESRKSSTTERTPTP